MNSGSSLVYKKWLATFRSLVKFLKLTYSFYIVHVSYFFVPRNLNAQRDKTFHKDIYGNFIHNCPFGCNQDIPHWVSGGMGVSTQWNIIQCQKEMSYPAQQASIKYSEKTACMMGEIFAKHISDRRSNQKKWASE